MWALVLFSGDKNKAVIKEELICELKSGKKPSLGDIVQVQWGLKRYEAKIIRFSTSKHYLEKLNVDRDTSEVILPTPKESRLTKNTNVAQNRVLVKEKKGLDDAKKNRKRKYEEELLTSMADTSASAAKKNKSLKRQVDQSSSTIKTRRTAEGRKNIAEVLGSKENVNDNISTSTKDQWNEKGDTNCPLCDLSSSIQVTPDTVMILQHVTNSLRLRMENQSGSSKSGELAQGGSRVDIPEWKIPSAGKVELMPGSGVWLDSVELGLMTKRNQENPNELLRKLLIWLVTEKGLALSCAVGMSADKNQLDPLMYKAVKDYVMKETGDDGQKFNRVVNQKCSQLARLYGLSGSSKKTSSPKQGAKKKSRSHRSSKMSRSFVPSSNGSANSTFALGSEDFDEVSGDKPLTQKLKMKKRGKEKKEDSDSALEEFAKWTERELGKRGMDLSSSSSIPFKLSTSCPSGLIDIDLIDNSLVNDHCKTSTPIKGPANAGAVAHSSRYLFGRPSSSSSSNSRDSLDLGQNKTKKDKETMVEEKTRKSKHSPTPRNPLSPKITNVKKSLTIRPTDLVAGGQRTQTLSIGAESNRSKDKRDKEKATEVNKTSTTIHDSVQVNPHHSEETNTESTSQQRHHSGMVPPPVLAEPPIPPNFPVGHANSAPVFPHEQQYFGGPPSQQQAWFYPHHFGYPQQSQPYSSYVDPNGNNVTPYNNFQTDWYGSVNSQFTNNDHPNTGPGNNNAPYQKF